MTEELMQPEFSFRLLGLFRAIDTLLADHHTLREALKPGYPSLGAYENGVWRAAPLDAGVARYGEGPMFGLWLTCRDVEALRVWWTGKPSPERPIAASPALEASATAPATGGSDVSSSV